MIIELSTGIDMPYESVEVERGTELRKIYEANRDKMEYDAYAAVVNNDVKPLTYKVHRNCNVRFIDLRTKAALIVYQNSLILILLKAIDDVLGDATAEVGMSMNSGLYVTFSSHEVTAAELKRIEKRMREIIERDLEITSEGSDYTIEGYTSRFYGLMVPSTGFLKYFELVKYHEGVLVRFPQPDTPEKIPEFADDPMMYNAFREQMKWNELLGVRYISDINNKIKEKSELVLIQMSEAQHDKKIVDIANRIIEEGKRIILILGPSSAGKTTTAKRLALHLKVSGLDSFYVSTDDYFVERDKTPKDETGQYNFEGIDAIDVDLFNQNMNDLLAGREVDVPVFDFKKGKKMFGTRMTLLDKDQPIIIEGLHAFNNKLTGKIPDKHKFKIYISPLTQINIDSHNRIPTTDARIIRRMVRDNRSRNYDATMTLRNWPKVHAGEIENIFPYTDDADVFFNTVHVYETAVLKKYAVPLLESVPREEPEYAEAQRLLRFFEDVADIEDDGIIPSDSILREFIGGSIYEN